VMGLRPVPRERGFEKNPETASLYTSWLCHLPSCLTIRPGYLLKKCRQLSECGPRAAETYGEKYLLCNKKRTYTDANKLESAVVELQDRSETLKLADRTCRLELGQFLH